MRRFRSLTLLLFVWGTSTFAEKEIEWVRVYDKEGRGGGEIPMSTFEWDPTPFEQTEDGLVTTDFFIDVGSKFGPFGHIGKRSFIGRNVVIDRFSSLYEHVSIGDDTRCGFDTYIEQLSSIGSNVVMGDHVRIRRGVRILNHTKIGNKVRIGKKTVVESHVVIEDNVRIGKSVSIGEGALLKKGVQIEDGRVIEAGQVVSDGSSGCTVS